MTLLFIYLGLLFAIGIHDYFRVKNFDDYVVAGRKQKQLPVTLSILATVIGASATMGISSLAVKHGFYAFLWLGSGGIALIMQSVFLSEKIRGMDAYTLPGLAEKVAGSWGRRISAAVIVISWTGIIAAQFVALSSIVAVLTGRQATTGLIILCSAVIILYTAFGGQFSIIKTDALQFGFVAAGIFAALFALFSHPVLASDPFAAFAYRGLPGESVSAGKILHLLFVVGGAYFVGPDIFSRNFTAESARTARKATLRAGFALIVFSFAVTLTGMAAAVIDQSMVSNPYIFIVEKIAGGISGPVIALGLLSAIISSTDTCIITTSAILEKDVLGRSSVMTTRIMVLLTGAVSLAIALYKKDILSLLTGTYSVFSPGIVIPVFMAVMAYGRRKLNRVLWVTAVIAGGSLGMAANLTGKEYLAIAGMILSAIISLASVFPVRQGRK